MYPIDRIHISFYNLGHRMHCVHLVKNPLCKQSENLRREKYENPYIGISFGAVHDLLPVCRLRH